MDDQQPVEQPPLVGAVFPPETGEERILITRVVDGDTVDFCYLVPARARLLGINTPEITGSTREAGLRAAGHLKILIPPDGLCMARLHGRDKYGRALIEPLTAGGKSICELMIAAGHAKPYDGQGPKP